VQTYASTEQMRDVLLALGISEDLVDTHLELLRKVKANEPITFPPMDIPQDVLWAQGFKVWMLFGLHSTTTGSNPG
jgi:hypothetical protein